MVIQEAIRGGYQKYLTEMFTNIRLCDFVLWKFCFSFHCHYSLTPALEVMWNKTFPGKIWLQCFLQNIKLNETPAEAEVECWMCFLKKMLIYWSNFSISATIETKKIKIEEMNETGFVLDFLQILIPNKAPLLLLSKGLVLLAWSQKYAKVTMLLVVWAWSISLNIDSVSSSTLAKPVHVYPM